MLAMAQDTFQTVTLLALALIVIILLVVRGR